MGIVMYSLQIVGSNSSIEQIMPIPVSGDNFSSHASFGEAEPPSGLTLRPANRALHGSLGGLHHISTVQQGVTTPAPTGSHAPFGAPAGQTGDVSRFYERVGEADALADESSQASELGDLAPQIRQLPVAERAEAHWRLVDETSLLRPQYRAVRLAILADQLPSLPVAQRASAFNQILSAAIAVPEQHLQAEPLLTSIIADQIPSLPPTSRPAAFYSLIDAPIAQSLEHRATGLAALPSQIGWLPLAARLEAFDRLYHAIASLPEPYQTGPRRELATLAHRIRSFARIPPPAAGPV
jgi:hypothetical protein